MVIGTSFLPELRPALPRPTKHVSVFVPCLEGGGERVMLDLAEGFHRRGLRVDLVLAKVQPGGPYMDQIRQGIRIFDLDAPSGGRKLLGLRRYLRAERPDAFLTFYDFFNCGALAKRLAGSPTVIVNGIHNTVSQLFRDDQIPNNWLRRLAFPPLLGLSDRIVAVSQGVKADLERLGATTPESRVDVIYNPVLHFNIEARAQQPLDHPFFSPVGGQPPVILGIGHLAPRKGFDLLIQAFARVRRQRPARLVILGEGPQRACLEGLIQNLGLGSDAVLPGLVPNPYCYLQRSSVFVLSSRFEGLGMVLIEALVLGIPVVATDCPSGPAEILEGGRYGALVPVDDPRAMADGIFRALDAEASNLSRQAEAAQYARKRFDLDTAVDQYLRVIAR